MHCSDLRGLLHRIMPFNLASGVLTVTGTENLADCTAGAVDGTPGRRVISVGRIVIAANAILTIDPETAILYLNGGARGGGVVQVDGRLNCGIDTDNFDDSFQRQSSGVAIFLSGSAGNGFSTFSVNVRSGGHLEWRGAAIKCLGTVNIDAAGTINTRNAVLIGSKSRQLRIRGSQATINGLRVIDSPVLIYNNPAGGLRGLEVINADQAQTGRNSYAVLAYGPTEGFSAFTGTILIEDFAAFGARNEFGLLDGVRADLRNAVAGSAVRCVAWLRPPEGNNARRSGYVRITKQLSINAALGSGAALDGVRIYVSDYDNGARLNTSFSDDTADKIVTDLTGSDGMLDIEVVTAIYAAVGTEVNGLPIIDRRSKFGDVRDIFDVLAWRYDLLPASLSVQCKGAGVGNVNFVMFPDATITETDSAVVAAYTEIDTPQKFYDAVKKYITDNYGGETEMPIARTGDLITVVENGLGVEIKGNAAQAFSFTRNERGIVQRVLVIKASVFVGNITTTGGAVVDLSNGAEIDGVIIDARGDSAIEFTENVDEWKIFGTEDDMLANVNAIDESDSSLVWRFTFTGARNYYARVRTGATYLGIDIPVTARGITTANISTEGLLTAQSAQISALAVPTSAENADAVSAALAVPTAEQNAAAVSAALSVPTAGENAVAVADALTVPSAGDIAAAVRALMPPAEFFTHSPRAPTTEEIGNAINALSPPSAFFTNTDNAPTVDEIKNGVWAKVINGDITASRALQIISAVIAGRTRLMEDGSIIEFLAVGGDDVILRATVTADGARTEITFPL